MKEFFYHNNLDENKYYVDLNEKTKKALVMHQVKNDSFLYKVHNFVNVKKLEQLNKFYLELESERFKLKSELAGITARISRNQISQLEFDLFTKSLNSIRHETPKRRIEGYWQIAINKTLKDLNDKIKFKKLLYGYLRHELLNGIDFIFSLLIEPSRITNIQVGIKYLKKKFRLDPLQFKNKTINFILPLSKRWKIFKNFIKNYENICLKSKENTKLTIVLFENQNDYIVARKSSFKQSYLVNNLIQRLNLKYSLRDENKIFLVVQNSKFSRSVACQLGASLHNSNDLIYFMDVDMKFNREFLFRVRVNTIQHKQVYFPIMFRQYGSNYRREFDFNLNSQNGYWRQYSFGNLAVYNSDLSLVGGFNTSHYGWGIEDQELFDKFLNSNLTVLRSPDPGLVHIYHDIKCDPQLPKLNLHMCYGTKANTYGSREYLANIYYEKYFHKFKSRNKKKLVKRKAKFKLF